MLTVLISSNQSAFIPSTFIIDIDNVIVTYEVLHSMKTKQKRKTRNMALKLDMSKAYNRIEWSYLKVVMKNYDLETNG